MKVFYYLRVKTKRWFARHMLIIEFCKKCGRKQPLVWTAADELWLAIHGSEGGIYCPECFTTLCEARGWFVRWIPVIEERV